MKNFFKQKRANIFLWTIVAGGAFLRLWQIGFSSYWLDESFTLMQAEGIANHGYPLLRSGLVEWKDLLMPYILALPVKLFGLRVEWLLRLPGAIFGIMSIIVAYFFARRLFTVQVGLIFSLFMSIGYWYIAWSRQVRGYSALIFFVLLFFYFLVRAEEHYRLKYIFYAFLSVGGAILAKKFGIFLWPAFLSYLFFRQRYKELVIFTLPVVVIAGVIMFSVADIVALNKHSYFSFYWQYYLWDYFGFFLVLGIWGFFTALRIEKKFQAVHLSIFILILTSLLALSFFLEITERRYLLMVTPFLFLYSAFLIDYLARKKIVISRVTKGKKIGEKRYLQKMMAFLLGSIFLGVYFQQGLSVLPRKYYPLEYYTPQPDYRSAYRAILQRGFGEEDIIVSPTPSLDIIYLGRADYVIPWSLTGQESRSNIYKEREFYSGARKLYGLGKKDAFDKITSLRKRGNVYVVLDALSSRRIKSDLWKKIVRQGEKIFLKNEPDRLTVYLFSKQ